MQSIESSLKFIFLIQLHFHLGLRVLRVLFYLRFSRFSNLPLHKTTTTEKNKERIFYWRIYAR
jgi:hypothetical protein